MTPLTSNSPNHPEPASHPVVWTLASSDSAGHAGIQADLRAITALGCHCACAISAVTAQNSQGIISVNPVSADVFADQLTALQQDLSPKAIKVGLIADEQHLSAIRDALELTDAAVIWDPVLASSTGHEFTNLICQQILALLPQISLFTPNLDEAEQLLNTQVRTPEQIITAADQLHQLGARGVLIKGGHGEGEHVQDYLSIQEADGSKTQAWLVQPKLNQTNLRGTGCTLASAIAAFVALGERLRDAVTLANAYVHAAIAQGYQVGHGAGPVKAGAYPSRIEDFPKVTDKLANLSSTHFADCGTTPLGLYPVVDSTDWLRKLLPLGITTAQIRIKDCPQPELEQQLKEAIELGREYNCRLFINDYWQLAIKHGAYGVHLGQEDIETADLEAIKTAGLRLGVSTHGDFEWARAVTLNPSYLAIGAIFPTDTKEVQIVGMDALKRWVSLLMPAYPLTAIGGITLDRLPSVLSTGIDSVAVVSAITKAPDYKQAVMQFQKALKSPQ